MTRDDDEERFTLDMPFEDAVRKLMGVQEAEDADADDGDD